MILIYSVYKSPTTVTSFILWKQNSSPAAPPPYWGLERSQHCFFAGDGIGWLCDLTPAGLLGLIPQHCPPFSFLASFSERLLAPVLNFARVVPSFRNFFLQCPRRLTHPLYRLQVRPLRFQEAALSLLRPQATACLHVAAPNFLVSEDSVHPLPFSTEFQLPLQAILYRACSLFLEQSEQTNESRAVT